MDRSEAHLEARAFRAYQLGRLRYGLRRSWLPLPLVAISAGGCSDPWCCFALGAALFAALVYFGWQGRAYDRAVVPGATAGLAAFAVPIVGEWLGVCSGVPAPMCLLLCLAGGALAGGALGARAGRLEQDRERFLLAAAVIAGLTGSLGSLTSGLAGVAGMVVGLALATPPAFVLARSRA